MHAYVYTRNARGSDVLDRSIDDILRPLSDSVPSFVFPHATLGPLTTFAGQGRSRRKIPRAGQPFSCDIGRRFNKHRVVPLVILSRISREMHQNRYKEVFLLEWERDRRNREVSFSVHYFTNFFSLTILALDTFIKIVAMWDVRTQAYRQHFVTGRWLYILQNRYDITQKKQRLPVEYTTVRVCTYKLFARLT